VFHTSEQIVELGGGQVMAPSRLRKAIEPEIVVVLHVASVDCSHASAKVTDK
jgi:hypothetical protein